MAKDVVYFFSIPLPRPNKNYVSRLILSFNPASSCFFLPTKLFREKSAEVKTLLKEDNVNILNIIIQFPNSIIYLEN